MLPQSYSTNQGRAWSVKCEHLPRWAGVSCQTKPSQDSTRKKKNSICDLGSYDSIAFPPWLPPPPTSLSFHPQGVKVCEGKGRIPIITVNYPLNVSLSPARWVICTRGDYPLKKLICAHVRLQKKVSLVERESDVNVCEPCDRMWHGKITAERPKQSFC